VRARFEFKLGPRSIAVILMGGLLAGLPGSLQSAAMEALSATTSLPAPAGVYAALTATEDAWLATAPLVSDPASWVTIRQGSETNPTGDKLYVNGSATATGVLTVGGDLVSDGALWWSNDSAALSTSNGGALELGSRAGTLPNPVANGAPYIDFHYGNGLAQDFNVRIVNSADNRLDFRSSASAGAVLSLVGDKVAVGRLTDNLGAVVAPQGSLDVGDEGVIAARAGSCTAVSYTYGATRTCPAVVAACATANSCYATFVRGFMAKYAAQGTTGNGSFLCCPCPAGGCPTNL
jgi:hypothetical protein